MPVTPNRGYFYPAAGDPNQIPADLQALAEGIDSDICDDITNPATRPVAQLRGTGTFMSLSASGIGGAQINRVPFDTIDFDTIGVTLMDQSINNRMIKLPVPGYYFVAATIQVPTFTVAGVTVTYLRWQIRLGQSLVPAAVAIRQSGDSANIPTNADDGNVKLLATSAGVFASGGNDSLSLEFQAITSPATAEFPVNVRTVTILKMT